MSFSLRFYKMTCEKNRVYKLNYLTNRLDFMGVLKSATSLSTPSVVIETSNGITDLEGYNYVHIYQFHRYYFITDMISISDKLTQVNMRVDVLMTFRAKFITLDAMIGRNENDFDMLIEDDLKPFISRRDVREYIPLQTPNPSSLVNTHFSAEYQTYNCVANIITWGEPLLADGTTTTYPFQSGTIFAPTGSNLPDIDADNWTIPYSSAIYVVYNQVDMGRIALGCNQNDRVGFLKGMIIYPFQVRRGNPTESRLLTLGVGDKYCKYKQGNVEDFVTGYYAYSCYSDYLVVSDFIVDFAPEWADWSPTTNYQIYLPFYGYTDFDVSSIINHRIIVYYIVNYENNQSQVYVYDMTSSRIIFTDACKLGVEVSLTTSNMRSVKTSEEALGLNYIMNQFASTYKAYKGAFEYASGGGIKSIEEGLGGLIANQIDLHNKANQLYVKGSATFGGQVAPLFSPMEVRIRESRAISTITDEEMGEYRRLYGLPLQQVRTLSSLTGFTIVSDIHLEGLDNALDGEINELYSLLTSGVIL